MSARALNQYLERHAQPEARAVLAELAREQGGTLQRFGSWVNAVVVPLYQESCDWYDALAAASRGAPGRQLWVIVLNAPEDAPTSAIAVNDETRRWLESKSVARVQIEGAPTLQLAALPEADVAIVDRSRPGYRLPKREAVGLARKIGNDVALALWSRGRVQSPWLYQSDGDARVPQGHFQRELPARAGAVAFPFEHLRGEDELVFRHTLAHEAWLRYHVLGLRWAGSRYAWQAIGSAMAVHALSYARARGFPRRDAAEDYHLLQKVSKLDGVRSLCGPSVGIVSRRSLRAPVGTGAAVERLLREPRVRFESPECYRLLGSALRALSAFAEHRGLGRFQAQVRESGPGSAELAAALVALGAERRLNVLGREATSRGDLQRRVHDWFDGIKALHVLHALRLTYPTLDAAEALARAPFTPDVYGVLASSTDWSRTCRALEALERAPNAWEEQRGR